MCAFVKVWHWNRKTRKQQQKSEIAYTYNKFITCLRYGGLVDGNRMYDRKKATGIKQWSMTIMHDHDKNIFTFHTFRLSIDTRRESHLPFELIQMARQWWHAKVKFMIFWAWFYRDHHWKYDKNETKNDVKRFSGTGTTFALIMTLNDCLMKIEIESCVCAIESDCHLYLNYRHNTGWLVTSKMKWFGTLIAYLILKFILKWKFWLKIQSSCVHLEQPSNIEYQTFSISY